MHPGMVQPHNVEPQPAICVHLFGPSGYLDMVGLALRYYPLPLTETVDVKPVLHTVLQRHRDRESHLGQDNIYYPCLDGNLVLSSWKICWILDN